MLGLTGETQNPTSKYPEAYRKIISVSVFVSVFSEYVAMYTYESNEQGDLTFQQGDIITVLKKEGDWWTGTVAGKTGVFPSNYVKPKDSEVRLSHLSIILNPGRFI